MKKIAYLLFLLPAVLFAGVTMVPEITPDPEVSLPVGETMGIDFVIDSSTMPFFGAVEWVGVGELSEPQYPGSPIIILPDPPYYPGFLPDNMWPVYYDPFAPEPIPPGVFAWTTYFADEIGNATINLYDLGDFTYFTLIDSFDIVVTPEPMTVVLLAFGALLARRK